MNNLDGPTNCYQCNYLAYMTASEHPYKCLKTGNRLPITEWDDVTGFLYLPKWCPKQKEAVR